MTWEVGKEYRTRGGHLARVYATDGQHGEIHAAIFFQGAWRMMAYLADGRYIRGAEHGYDLMPPIPPVVVSDSVLTAFLEGDADTKAVFGGSSWSRNFRKCLAAAIEAYLREQGEGAK